MTPANPASYGAHVLTRLLVALLGLVLAVFMVAWLLAFLSFLGTGAFFGHLLPFRIPGWLVIIGLFVLYGMATGPLRAACHAATAPWHPHGGAWVGALNGMVSFAVVLALVVYAVHHPAEIHAYIGELRGWLEGLRGPGGPTTST